MKKGHKQREYGWFQRWADIEAGAMALRWYEPLVRPGLLQTEDYARAIFIAHLSGDADDLDERVAARMARQLVLDRAKLWCVLDEGVLRRDVGGGKVCVRHAEHPVARRRP